MFEVKNQEILKYVSDYKMNIIVPSEIDDMAKFHTDLKQVLEFIKISNEKEKVRELIEKKQKSYESLDNEAVMVLNACIDAKLKVNKEGGRTNMCKGIQGLIDDARQEGIQEEHERMCKGIQGLIDDARQEGIQEEHERMCKGIQGLVDDAKQKGIQEEHEKCIISLYRRGFLNEEVTAKELNITVKKLRERLSTL